MQMRMRVVNSNGLVIIASEGIGGKKKIKEVIERTSVICQRADIGSLFLPKCFFVIPLISQPPHLGVYSDLPTLPQLQGTSRDSLHTHGRSEYRLHPLHTINNYKRVDFSSPGISNQSELRI